MTQRKQTIFVGLSGGVDSSVAALRLKKAGHDVVGVFIKVWHPDFLPCNWEAERLDAMRVAAHLEIPFLTCDAEAAYRDSVAAYFIDGYARGETPNPDVMCNTFVKFGAFWEFAQSHGADGIATGHYAIRTGEGARAALHRGADRTKDQSYFLWSIRRELLPRIYFPIGDTPKDRVRKEAARAGIPTASKKDSQGICFLGHVDVSEFLSHYVTLEQGSVLDEQGNTIGSHKGAATYTIGQRHGFTIDTGGTATVPHYVTGKNMAHNTITVSPVRPTVAAGTLELHGVNWLISPETQQTLHGGEVYIQTRYRQEPVKARIIAHRGDALTLALQESLDAPSPGQSCVLYRDTLCLGGGTIHVVR